MKKSFSSTILFASCALALQISTTSLLADEPTAAAASPAASATPQAANDDLSQYKNADELFAHYEAVSKQHPDHKFASQDEAVQYLKQQIQSLDAITADFEKRFPKDPRRWNMEFARVMTSGLRNFAGIGGGAKNAEEAQAKLQTILDASDAPAGVKKSAFIGLAGNGTTSVHDDVSYAKWEQKVKALSEKYPGMADHNDELELLRASILARFDTDKAIAAFNDIANTAKDPAASAKAKQYAEELTQQAAEEKKEKALVEDLKKSPLDLKFTAVDGSEVDLAKLRGKVVLIDFWATWCGPCMGEVPNVVATYNALHDKGFEIVGISFDQDKASLLKITKAKGMVWPQYFDGKGWQNDFGTRFGIHAIPAMWLINKKGMLVTTDGRENLAEQVKKLLAE